MLIEVVYELGPRNSIGFKFIKCTSHSKKIKPLFSQPSVNTFCCIFGIIVKLKRHKKD
jgi:hypothetical protein